MRSNLDEIMPELKNIDSFIQKAGPSVIPGIILNILNNCRDMASISLQNKYTAGSKEYNKAIADYDARIDKMMTEIKDLLTRSPFPL